MLELPTQKTPAKLVDPRIIVLYSKPKIGKTTITANLESNLILDFEEGTDMVDAVKLTIIGLQRYTYDPVETKEQEAARHAEGKYYLIEVLRALKKKKEETGKLPYTFITVDTVTRLEEMCEADATDAYMQSPQGRGWNRYSPEEEEMNPNHVTGTLKPRAKWEPVTKLGRGYGYRWLWESYEKWINRLKPFCEHLILVGHVKLVSIVKKEGTEVDQKDLELTGKIKQLTTSKYADAIGYVYRSGLENYVSFMPTDEVACGSRAAHLEGQNILISKKLENGKVEVYWHNIFKRLIEK